MGTIPSCLCILLWSSSSTPDIADTAAIHYLVSRVDDIDDDDESTGEVVEDDSDEDDSNDEDVDENLHRTATEIATMTDDSGFCSDAEDGTQLEVISGPGTSWMGRVPSYSLKAPAVGSQSNMHTASHSEEVTGSSFDAFLRVRQWVWCGQADGGPGPASGLHHSSRTETTTRTG